MYIQKVKILQDVFIYIQKARHFPKSMITCVRFLFTKIHTFSVTQNFRKMLKLAFKYIQKSWHFALRDVFIYKNPDTLKKNKTVCVTIFYIQKS